MRCSAKPLLLVIPGLIPVLMIIGCSHSKSPYSATGDGFFQLNEGYSLLHGLVSKNQNIDKLLIVKTEEGDVHTQIGRNADACARVTKQLETFARLDGRLNLELNTLPWLEQRTREAIADTRTGILLLSTGWRFELELLQTQVEALNYGTHLARMIEETEVHEARKAYLGAVAKDFDDLHRQTLDLMASRYKP